MIHRKVTIHFRDKTVTIYSINQHVESCGPVVRTAIKPECRQHFGGNSFYQEIACLDSPEAASNCAQSMNENITKALECMKYNPPEHDALIVVNFSPPPGKFKLSELRTAIREKVLSERVQRDILNLHLPDEPITCDKPSLVDQQIARSTITGEILGVQPALFTGVRGFCLSGREHIPERPADRDGAIRDSIHKSIDQINIEYDECLKMEASAAYDKKNPPIRRYLWDRVSPARTSVLFDRYGLDFFMGRRQFRCATDAIKSRLLSVPSFCVNLRNSLRAQLVTALEGIIETEYVAGFPASPGTDPIGVALLGHIWSEFSDVRDPAVISGMRSALMAANMTAQRDADPSCIENVRRLGLRAEELQEICEAINAARGDEPSEFSGMGGGDRERIEIIFRDCFCNPREEVRDAARACVTLSATINSLTSPIGRKGSEALVKAIHQMASMLP